MKRDDNLKTVAKVFLKPGVVGFGNGRPMNNKIALSSGEIKTQWRQRFRRARPGKKVRKTIWGY